MKLTINKFLRYLFLAQFSTRFSIIQETVPERFMTVRGERKITIQIRRIKSINSNFYFLFSRIPGNQF